MTFGMESAGAAEESNDRRVVSLGYPDPVIGTRKLFVAGKDTILEVNSRRVDIAPSFTQHQGVGWKLRQCGSKDSVVIYRFTDVKVNPLDVLGLIATEARLRRREGEGYNSAECYSLSTSLAGFTKWSNLGFARLISIPIANEAYENLYHDSGICRLTLVCCEKTCKYASHKAYKLARWNIFHRAIDWVHSKVAGGRRPRKSSVLPRIPTENENDEDDL